MSDFDIRKYLGVWYELVHYPSWFQRNDNYNTTAEYSLANETDMVIKVVNSSIAQGQKFESVGSAKYLGGNNLRVDFAPKEVGKLVQSGQFKQFQGMMDQNAPNYVIDKIWTNAYGQYIFAVVTDPAKQSLYVLSRYANPSLAAYNEIMQYVIQNYDRDRLVQTPHFL